MSTKNADANEIYAHSHSHLHAHKLRIRALFFVQLFFLVVRLFQFENVSRVTHVYTFNIHLSVSLYVFLLFFLLIV